MKNKILLKIEEFLQTNKNVLLLMLAVTLFVTLPMFVFGVKQTIIGGAMLIGTVIWCGVFCFLLRYALYKIFNF